MGRGGGMFGGYGAVVGRMVFGGSNAWGIPDLLPLGEERAGGGEANRKLSARSILKLPLYPYRHAHRMESATSFLRTGGLSRCGIGR